MHDLLILLAYCCGERVLTSGVRARLKLNGERTARRIKGNKPVNATSFTSCIVIELNRMFHLSYELECTGKFGIYNI